MRILCFLLILGFIQFSSAQEYEPFTEKETTLILNQPDEMMRVYNLSSSIDSLVLRSVSLFVNPSDKLTKVLAERMLKTVVDPDNTGVGIAAPQVGINRRMIVVQRFDKEEYPFEVFVNPEILWKSDLLQLGPEGDLSFEARGNVWRHYIIEVKYQTLEGETKKEILEAFTAVIFQHERDHLDGILLTDRIEEQKENTYFRAEEEENLYFLKK